MTNPIGEIITMRFQVFPNPMDDHRRIAYGPIAKLLQEFIKGIVVNLDTVVSVREKVFEKPRSCGGLLKSEDDFRQR
jgi:predicted house-cleaning NTP pyrophosphatase (Maf/HAM1 superfamily)